METRTNPEHVRMTTDADRVVTVWLDRPGKPVNTITRQMQHDLSAALDDIERDLPAGVIFTSAKARSFAAGADLFEIREMSKDQIGQYLADGQGLFNRIAELQMPTVAAINGDCLGGGLELRWLALIALRQTKVPSTSACRKRSWEFFPPGAARSACRGSLAWRCTLPLMLAGKTLPPAKARKAGMIDEVVRPEALLAAAKRLALSSAPRHRPPFIARGGDSGRLGAKQDPCPGRKEDAQKQRMAIIRLPSS